MSAEKLCCRMDNNICTMLNRTDEIWCTESIINHKRNTMLMCKLAKRIDIGNITVGIAKCFDIDGSCIILNSRFDFFKVVDVYKTCCNTKVRKRMRQQIITATIDRFLYNKVTAVLTECLKSVGDSRCTGGKSQSCNATLKCCHTLFENILCRVSKSAVYVTCISKTEACGSVFAVMEHIRSGCVNWYRTGIGCGIRIFLTYMEL